MKVINPGTAIKAVAQFMEKQMQQQQLMADDLRYAAVLFLNMVRGHYRMQLLMGMELTVSGKFLSAHVRKAVDQFLALYDINLVHGFPMSQVASLPLPVEG